MSTNKLLTRLKQLYQVAVIRPEEEGDDARANEARNAAFLLLKLAREGGVKIRFETVRAETPAPPAPQPPQGVYPRPGVEVRPYRVDLNGFSFDFGNVFDTSMWRTAHGVDGSNEVDRRANEAARRAQAMPKALLIATQIQAVCRSCACRIIPPCKAWWRRGHGTTCEACGPGMLDSAP